MKKLLIFNLIVIGMISANVAQIRIEEKINSSTVMKYQKSATEWDIVASGTITPKPNFSTGFVYHITDSSSTVYAIGGTSGKLYTINPVSQKNIDSVQITGLVAHKGAGLQAMDITSDGQYLYVANFTDTIFRINLETKSVDSLMILTKGTSARGIAYAPDADNGQGGFWVLGGSSSTLITSNLNLYSRSLTKLKTINLSSLNYKGIETCWVMDYDTISEGGPYLWLLNRYPQDMLKINVETGKISAPIHSVSDDKPEWGNNYAYAIYICPNLLVNGVQKNVLGVGFPANCHILYDLDSMQMDSIAVEITAVEMERFQKINTTTPVSILTKMEGENPITSCKMLYEIEGTIKSCSLSNIAINSYTKDVKLTSTEQLTIPSETGEYTLKVWLDSLNDIDGTTTDTIYFTIVAYDQIVPRVVLHEGFTASTCSPCKAGNANLSRIFNTLGSEDYVCIKYQMNWPNPGDPYFTTEAQTRRTYYGISSVPSLKVDGSGEEFGNDPRNYNINIFRAKAEVPAFVDMKATFTYNGEKSYKIDLEINPLYSYPKGHVLFVALVERETHNNRHPQAVSLTNKQLYTQGWDTVWHHVMKKMVSSTSGDAITLEKGTSVTKTYEYVFPGSYRLPTSASSPINIRTEHSVENFNNIYAVYWIQNTSTKEILQAGKVGAASSIKEKMKIGNIEIYPNPAKDMLTIQSEENIQEVNIYNVMGQKVKDLHVGTNHISVDIANLSKGMYIIQITTQNGKSVKKFIKE